MVMLDRSVEPNIDTDDDVEYGVSLETELPKELPETLPPLSDTRTAILTGSAGATPRITLPRYDEEIDGWLIYCVNDVAANQGDQIRVSNSPATGDANDDIITPGKAVLIMYAGNFITVQNMSANAHTVIVKAFRGWLPAYF